LGEKTGTYPEKGEDRPGGLLERLQGERGEEGDFKRGPKLKGCVRKGDDSRPEGNITRSENGGKAPATTRNVRAWAQSEGGVLAV